LHDKLLEAPLNARLVTYYIKVPHVPDAFTLHSEHEDGFMKLWIRTK
jgi:hypothetical protein